MRASRSTTGKSVLAIIAVAMLALAACGGSKAKASSTAPGSLAANTSSANVANFCHDYTIAANDYQQSGGDITDPNFIEFQVYLEKAQKEAPAAVASDVTSMLNEVNRVVNSNAANGVNGDVTQFSERITAWANTNCTSTATSDTSGSNVTDNSGSCTTDDLGSCTTDTSGDSLTTTTVAMCYPNGNPPLDPVTSDAGLVPCPNP